MAGLAAQPQPRETETGDERLTEEGMARKTEG